MNKLKQIISSFSLKENEKEEMYLKFKNNQIYDIKFLQNKAYVSFMNGDIIILKNIDIYATKLLNEIKEFFDNESSKNNNTKDFKQTYWTDNEINFLKENYKKCTSKEIGKLLNKSIYQVEAKKVSLKLYPVKPWSSDELIFLRENKDKSLYELSEELQRTFASIKAKKRVLFLKDFF